MRFELRRRRARHGFRSHRRDARWNRAATRPQVRAVERDARHARNRDARTELRDASERAVRHRLARRVLRRKRNAGTGQRLERRLALGRHAQLPRRPRRAQRGLRLVRQRHAHEQSGGGAHDRKKISVYATEFAPNGGHDVHKEYGYTTDGAIVIDPGSATSKLLLFRFDDSPQF